MFPHSFPVSGDFCCQLITFANSCSQISSNRTLVLIWIHTVLHSDSVLERCFEKNYLEKSKQMATKVLKLSSVQRVIKFRLIEIIHVSACVFVE